MNSLFNYLLDNNHDQLDFSRSSEVYWNSPQQIANTTSDGDIVTNYLANKETIVTLPSRPPLEVTVAEDNSFIIPLQEQIYITQQTIITLIVDITTDQNDSSASNGLSLRDAILIANADTNNDYLIQLQGGQTYSLTLRTTSGSEDAALTGDLDILDGGNITVQGVGNQKATINARQISNRVFEVFENGNLALVNTLLTAGIGGAITINQNGNATINNSTISNNTRGGIHNYGTATIIDSEISGNISDLLNRSPAGGINNTGTMTIDNSTVSNNYEYLNSGGIFNSGNLTITNSAINSNRSGGYNGGGLNNTGTATINNSTFSNNQAKGGGGIDNEGTLNLSSSLISNNVSTTPVATASGINNNDGATLTIANSLITGNSKPSSNLGGAIYNRGFLTVRQSNISENESAQGDSEFQSGIKNLVTAIIIDSSIQNNTGNGISNDFLGSNAARLVVINSTVSGNSERGISVGKGNATIINSTLNNNQDGGLINFAKTNIINSTIANNITTQLGGGILNGTTSDTFILSSTIANNTSPYGGGIYNGGQNKAVIINSTINNNNSSHGGGIYNYLNSGRIPGNTNNFDDDGDGQIDESDEANIDVLVSFGVDLTLLNTTLSGNVANGYGGGIFDGSINLNALGTTSFPSVITINNSTITNNTADADNNGDGNGGGIFTQFEGEVNVANTIIASNFDTPNNGGVGDIFPDVVGSKITGNNYNLIGSLAGSSGNIGVGTDLVTSNPGLSPLQNNGGSSQVWFGVPEFPNGIPFNGVTLTHALLSTSPAIDHGNNASIPIDVNDLDDDADKTEQLSVDQRGKNFPRIFNGTVDIGAVEFIFDPAQYGISNPDLIPIFRDNLEAYYQHFYTSGRFEGRNTDTFDELRYTASNIDLIPVFRFDPAGAAQHYLQSGSFEGRSLTAFEPNQYLASNLDLISVFGYNLTEITRHYVQSGFFESRSLDSFDELRYLASNKDLIQAFGLNPAAATQHYLQSGAFEGRSLTAFEADRYIASNSDLIGALGYNLLEGTLHYINHGALIDNRLTTSFNAVDYLNRYSDLQVVLDNNLAAATQHYIEHGFTEGRTGF